MAYVGIRPISVMNMFFERSDLFADSQTELGSILDYKVIITNLPETTILDLSFGRRCLENPRSPLYQGFSLPTYF